MPRTSHTPPADESNAAVGAVPKDQSAFNNCLDR